MIFYSCCAYLCLCVLLVSSLRESPRIPCQVCRAMGVRNRHSSSIRQPQSSLAQHSRDIREGGLQKPSTSSVMYFETTLARAASAHTGRSNARKSCYPGVKNYSRTVHRISGLPPVHQGAPVARHGWLTRLGRYTGLVLLTACIE
jgi:hypothetical protein